MKVWGLTEFDIEEAVTRVSERYNGNVYIDRMSTVSPRSRCVQVHIRCYRSDAPGARSSASGRRSIAASWYAYRDVMRELFDVGAKRILTGLYGKWDYRGADDFEDRHEESKYVNVGSRMFPVAYGEL